MTPSISGWDSSSFCCSMGESFVKDLLSMCLERISMEQDVSNSELAFLQVTRNFEATRMKWLHAELDLKKCRELLLKSDVVRAALEVQLKHARNQVDVEIKKRYKAEADHQYLERQIKLICDILVNDSKSSACLNDEQRSMLANFNHKGLDVPQQKGKRLSVIDESSFLSHSDISYDRTDDDLDLDTAVLRPLKSRAREKRRSSLGPNVRHQRRSRMSGRSGDLLGVGSTEKEVETTVVKASVSTPEGGSSIQLVIGITQEPLENPRRDHIYESSPSVMDQTSVWVSDESKMEAQTVTDMELTCTEPKLPEVVSPTEDRTLRHVFLSKTVIRPETCGPCGKRIRFGKMAVKCRDCRLISHPECKHMCNEPCSPSAHGNPQPTEGTLESFAPSTQPRIPQLITQCVNEIEKRGFQERGIYRVPGGERTVKELRERYLSGKGPLLLNKVYDVHVICGLLKDFLRKLKEPLITFQLHHKFMEASEIAEDDNSAAMTFQAIGELPAVNRDTLAFLMLHLQRVMKSPVCQMDLNNLARVFGPTIVGHSIPEPSPLTIMRDTTTQPKVMARLLSFRAEYWRSLLRKEKSVSTPTDTKINIDGKGTDRNHMFTPVRSPEKVTYDKVPSASSLKGRIKTFGNAFGSSKPKPDSRNSRFFISPK
ncbi:rac GTPase-activating protein 1 isoform X2 [Clupea harengus]|uniref:Rac GTPase-activating protein 1 isoform X2 n=1 Tax=Clupea harengus TaxID=7950 RepID=A0A6P8H7N7_CLUHA|nr:rac GTPase-activating protein 1 isoform X2 [Clupea harengus]